MSNTWLRGTPAVIITLLLVVLFAFMIPAVIVAQESPDELTISQIEGESVFLTTDLQVSLDDVQDTNGQIDVTFIDTETGETASVSNIAVGSSDSATIGGETVTVFNRKQVSATEAIVTYEYPLYYSWPTGIQFVVENIVLILLALSVLFLTALIIAAFEIGGNDD